MTGGERLDRWGVFGTESATPFERRARDGASPGHGTYASKPPDGVSIEPLSDATLEGARAVWNDFVRRSNKRFLFGCCPACDESARQFARPFEADPSRLRTAAVAVRRADGKVIGAVVCTTHGQMRTEEERSVAPDPKPGASHVEWIAVLPEARGGGIGAALLTHAFSAVGKICGTRGRSTSR